MQFLQLKSGFNLLTMVTVTSTVSMTAVSMSSQVGLAAPQSAPVKHTAEEFINQIPNVKFNKNLPDNFPIPKYPQNVTKTNFVYSTKGLPAASANIVTSDTPQKVFDWYQDACKKSGWQIKVPTDKAMDQLGKKGSLFMIEGDKSKEHMSLFCTPQKKTPGTMISINWSKTP